MTPFDRNLVRNSVVFTTWFSKPPRGYPHVKMLLRLGDLSDPQSPIWRACGHPFAFKWLHVGPFLVPCWFLVMPLEPIQKSYLISCQFFVSTVFATLLSTEAPGSKTWVGGTPEGIPIHYNRSFITSSPYEFVLSYPKM